MTSIVDWTQEATIKTEEISAIFGLIYLFPLAMKPSIEAYWEKFSPVHIPYFAKVISLERFKLIASKIAFN